MLELNQVYQMDCFDLMAQCDDQSVDMILADFPYGTTACAWDSIIPFEPLWAAFKRVIKPRGAIVLTASQPFTSALIMSNPAWFRHEWIWEKPAGTGYLNANRGPMKNHESVLVFGSGQVPYYPQKETGEPYRATSGAVGGFVRDKSVGGYLTENTGERFPKTVLKYDGEMGLHPTQKPLPLWVYLLRTYTRPGELVLDPTCGSGTTAIAARNEGRHFICGDSDPGYVQIARDRLAQPYTIPMFADVPTDEKPTQTGFLD